MFSKFFVCIAIIDFGMSTKMTLQVKVDILNKYYYFYIYPSFNIVLILKGNQILYCYHSTFFKQQTQLLDTLITTLTFVMIQHAPTFICLKYSDYHL